MKYRSWGVWKENKSIFRTRESNKVGNTYGNLVKTETSLGLKDRERRRQGLGRKPDGCESVLLDRYSQSVKDSRNTGPRPSVNTKPNWSEVLLRWVISPKLEKRTP